MVNAGEDFRDGRAVGDHTASTHDLGQVTTRHHCRWLVVDTALEASRAPVHKLDGTLGLNGGHRCVHVLWYNVTSVPEQQAALQLATRSSNPEPTMTCEHAHGYGSRIGTQKWNPGYWNPWWFNFDAYPHHGTARHIMARAHTSARTHTHTQTLQIINVDKC